VIGTPKIHPLLEIKFHKIHIEKLSHFKIDCLFKIRGKETELTGFKSKLEANKFLKKYL